MSAVPASVATSSPAIGAGQYARSNARSRRFVWDVPLVMITAAIVVFGMVMVTSASITIADRQYHEPFYFLQHQVLGVGLGVLAIFTIIWIPVVVWQRMSVPLLIFAFVLLVLVLIPGIGHEVNGSRRWIRAGLNFQVSELARVLMLMYVASYIVRKQTEIKEDLKGFLKPLGLLIAAGGLLLLEPDFGAATVMIATGLGMLFLAGVKWRNYLALVAIASAGMGLIAITSEYRLKRLASFMHPWSDPFNTGFQLVQSLIAIGRGEWFGVGLGASVQKLFYLPEAHTDFVFAVLAEELGLIGVLATLTLFVLLVARSFQIARRAAEANLSYHAFFASGFGIWLALQVAINVGVNMGVLPTKGLTLPLMSYGGSSVMVTLAWIGILLRVSHEASVASRTAVSRRERSE
jgi:cell division protein FtsW